jgi:Flp pilus assembly protein TadD
MISLATKGARLGLAILGAGMIAAGAAAAQAAQQPGSAASGADDPLSRNLRTLADNPRSLVALMGAGKASLDVGDPQAALTFFGRAEEIAPRDGRIKMWIGSALTQLEQPRSALKFFEAALALGAAEADVARDRGLAFDMLGDPRRAQRDYELALRRGSDPEVTRRLALSLAISGERERALQLLEDQLLVQDRAAQRTRAFVLALTGDTAGADRAAQAAMPGPQAAAMAPFLARLSSLSLSDRALAVHFGHFPGTGESASAPTYGAYASRDAIRAGAPDSGQAALGSPLTPSPAPLSTAPRRRPGTEEAAPAGSSTAPAVRIAEAKPPPVLQPEQRPAVQPTQPAVIAAVDGPKPEPAQVPPAPVSAPVPAPASTAADGSQTRLADVAATLAILSDPNSPSSGARPARANPPAAAGSRSATRAAAPPAARASATRTAAASAAGKKAAPPPREPRRVWVQVAGGANRSMLPREYGRLKGKAPKLLGARTPWTTTANATNRLLVGPFASAREAQAFVNELAKLDVAAFAWTSEAGQKVERLPAR